MATDRLSAQVIADDSLPTWRFEKPAGTLAFAAAGGRLAAPNLVAVRPTVADDCIVALGTGGETGTTLDYYLKLDGATDKLTIFTAGGIAAVTIDSAGAVTINGAPTILTGTATINPPAMGTGDNFAFTVTVTGASTTGTPAVALGFSIDYPDALIVEQARVSAADTVAVGLRYEGGGGIDVASHTVRATVFQ